MTEEEVAWARFVLLSAGHDRLTAALILTEAHGAADFLERCRVLSERYLKGR